jgi:dipeptidyl aminopeptidase/acylaminoacyl peptidase
VSFIPPFPPHHHSDSRLLPSVEVNYGGSTGFGVAYRESLNDRWGILDIQDAWESVLQLGSLGLVDPSRAVIAGQSAGGYSVLQAATTLSSLFPTSNSSSSGTQELFRAGIPRYGVSDMQKMQMMMHKFELGILDRAIGKWEDNKEVWHERSPIFHADKITMPMLVCFLHYVCS